MGMIRGKEREMASSTLPPIYNEIVDYLVEKATPQEILAFQASDSARRRAEELFERSNEGTLTPDERVELEHIVEIESLMSLLKAKAMLALTLQ